VVLLDRENEALSKSPATNILLSNIPIISLPHLHFGFYWKAQGRHDPAPRAGQFPPVHGRNPWDGGLRHAPAVTTTSFDISILEFLLPLVCGAQIVIATAEQAADVASLKNC